MEIIFFFQFYVDSLNEKRGKLFFEATNKALSPSIFLIADNFFSTFARNIKFDVKFNKIYCAYVLYTHILTTDGEWDEKR